MSSLQRPSQALLLGSFLFRKDLVIPEELISIWQDRFGSSFEFYHNYFPMKRYYSKEMGEENLLSRFFMVSSTLYERTALVDEKHWANSVESFYSLNEKRKVNLDIGVISLENFQLATGKPFTHRVYLREGVYSDLTLIFKGKSYEALDWSYPDYQHSDVIDFLNTMRLFLKERISQ